MLRLVQNLLLCGLFATVSCTQDLTQIVALVSSDFGDELHQVGIDIENSRGELISSNDFFLAQENIALPFSFTIEPGANFRDQNIRVTALGFDASGKALVEYSARLGFVEQQRRLLHIDLLRVCKPVECAQLNQTCSAQGQCVNDYVEVKDLPVVNPGEEFTTVRLPPNNNTDAGLPPDATQNSDSGSSEEKSDAGGLDANVDPIKPTTCVDVGCPINQVCVDPATHSICDASTESPERCGCRVACDPFGAVLRCGFSNDICTYLNENPPRGQGYCRPNLGGGEQGDSCTTQFNEKGERISDDCNRTKNFTCTGVTSTRPTGGQCARTCRTDLFLNCQFLLSETTFSCTPDEKDPDSIIGTCRLPEQAYTDISRSCFTQQECQSQSCLDTGVQGICTSDCSGLETCPGDSACLPVRRNANNEFLCFRSCDDDADCTSKNQNNVCHPIGDRKICYPRCELTNNRCPGSQGTCNPRTGLCD